MNKPELETQLKEKINELLPILKKNNNVENVKESFFCYQSNKTIVKIMTYSEKETYNAPLKLLLSQKGVPDKYSEDFIDKKLVEYYHKLLSDETKFDEYIKEIAKFILTDGIKDYFVFSEIENIRILDDQKYEFIESTIKILKEEDLPFKKEQFTLFGTDNFNPLNKPAIFTNVKAGESEKAKEIALHNFLVSFNLIKLYATNFKPVLKGCLLSGNQELVVYDETDKSMSANLSKVGELLLNHAYLNNELYTQLKNAGIEELRKPTKISQVVKECLYWFGLGLDEKYPSARLINFVTVLESTLKKKDETTELRRTVSERGAILLYDKFEQRKEAFKQLREIYDTRSKVVHTGVLIDNKDLASLAGGYARVVLINLIKKAKEFNGNFDDFIMSIDDIKFGKHDKDEKPTAEKHKDIEVSS